MQSPERLSIVVLIMLWSLDSLFIVILLNGITIVFVTLIFFFFFIVFLMK